MNIKIVLIIVVIILFLFLLFMTSSPTKEVEEKIVTKIIDGDTIVVEGGETIRLLGMDCDERGKACYNDAKDKIEELLLGKKVNLESDIEEKDFYGRSLRYVFLDGDNVNSKMVKEGYCVARFVEDSKYKEEIVESERFAIENKIGCKWNESD